MIENEPNPVKLYSQKAILVSTVFAGPIATGILLRKNFINLGQKDYGNNALVICIVFTVLLLATSYMIPEHIMNMIPKHLIPGIYTLATYLLLKKYMEKSFLEHKEKNGQFYSGWNAFGISIISLAAMIALILGNIFFIEVDVDTKKLEQSYEQFSKNEEKALELYTIPDTCNTKIIAFIDSMSIPKWQENALIVENMNKMDDLPEEIVKQNESLLRYCTLRIQSLQLIKKSKKENTTEYDLELIKLTMEIDNLLKTLNKE